MARYHKPATMDVGEHLSAHLAKEEDLLRRQNVAISQDELNTSLYGSTDTDRKHTTGQFEDTVVSRLLDSLGPSEGPLVEFLDSLLLLQGTSSWTLQPLIDAIRTYERKQHSLPQSSSTKEGAAIIRYYQAKSDARSSRSKVRSYDL